MDIVTGNLNEKDEDYDIEEHNQNIQSVKSTPQLSSASPDEKPDLNLQQIKRVHTAIKFSFALESLIINLYRGGAVKVCILYLSLLKIINCVYNVTCF